MGPIKTKGTFTRFLASAGLKKLSLEQLKNGILKGAFVPRELGVDETNAGFALHGDELSTAFDLLNTCVGGYAVFSMRIDRLNIDRTVLKMRINHRLAGAEGLSLAERTSIKEGVLDEMAANAYPTSRIHTVILDRENGQVFFSGSSLGDQDVFREMFQKCFGIKLQAANFALLALRTLGEDEFERVLDNPSAEYHDEALEIHPEFEDSLEGRLGSSFLTTVLYWSATSGELDGMTFQFIAEDPISFSGETLGARNVTLKGGVVNRSAELKAALKMGKRVSDMRITFANNDIGEDIPMIVSLDKQNAKFSRFSLGKPYVHDQYGKTLETLGRLSLLAEMVDELFQRYLEIRYQGPKWEENRKAAIRWIENL